MESLRTILRRWFYRFVGRAFSTDDGRRIACGAVSSLAVRHPRELLRGVPLAAPYPDLGAPQRAPRPSDRSDVVIITGRFRSGSTLLWNLFRRAGGFTSFYEPFNERRWFDPAARGDRTDPTHRNVSDYWREYDGLEVLERYYHEDWIRRDLLMDADAWAPDMKEYVDILIDRAPGRPVLQFNRVDFRLPWFRRHYPAATYVHIFRHPRDQWCSTLMDDVGRVPPHASMADFRPFDKFYLGVWAEDLKYHFPFLDERRVEHPYRLYYYIWKLSYLFGRKYCDRSVAFERLIQAPDEEILGLFHAVGVESADLDSLKGVMVVPSLGRWRQYADDGWFRTHEAHCDEVIADFLTSASRNRPLAATSRPVVPGIAAVTHPREPDRRIPAPGFESATATL